MLLEVAAQNGVNIPSLCHDPRLQPFGACRQCLVELEVRHAEATKADLTINFGQEAANFVIQDYGRGIISLPHQVDDLVRQGKLGLAGMFERIRLIAGKPNEIDTKPKYNDRHSIPLMFSGLPDHYHLFPPH